MKSAAPDGARPIECSHEVQTVSQRLYRQAIASRWAVLADIKPF